MNQAGRLSMMGGGKLSAKSYVQDGLIAIWDGIENAGWGVHDPNATTWVNLAGGSIADITLYTQNCEWASDALVGNDRAFVDASTVLALGSCPMPNNYKTGEFLIKQGDVLGVLFMKGAPNTGNVVIGHIYSGRGFQMAYINGASGGVPHTPNRRYYAARTGTSFLEGGVCYKNGVLYSGGFYRSNITGANRFGEGYRSNANNAIPFIGEICAMRFYNRELTAEEIAYNYNIDNRRFNLP